jgi:hypothetical protein
MAARLPHKSHSALVGRDAVQIDTVRLAYFLLSSFWLGHPE